MSNVIGIDDLKKKLQEEAEQQDQKKAMIAQFQAIEKCLYRIKELEEKNNHLEQLLLTTKPTIGGLQNFSPEEAICLQQIKILESRSMDRELTMEEVKKLDLLVKNLRLIQGANANAPKIDPAEEMSEADLVAAIATEE